MFDVIAYPNPVLVNPTKEVAVFDEELKFLVGMMFKTMYHHRGVGLAANQIAINKRMFVMDIDGKTPELLINPVILEQSEETIKMEEGCLSFKGFLVDIVRPKTVTIGYCDIDGRYQEKFFDGMAARCAQHENQHLNGQTFLNNLSKLHRDMITRKLRKRDER